MNKIMCFLSKYKSFFCMLSFILILILIGAPFFNWIATNEWNWKFINENNYSSWIAYYGSILGGSITLIGVWWTLIDQKNKREKELDLDNLPSPIFHLAYYNPEKQELSNRIKNILTIDSVYDNKFEHETCLFLPIYILGSPATLFNLKLLRAKIECFENDSNESIPKVSCFLKHSKDIITTILPDKTKLKIEFLFPIQQKENAILDDIKKNKLNYTIELAFEYMNKLNKVHSIVVVFGFDILTSETENDIHIYRTNKTKYTSYIKEIK